MTTLKNVLLFHCVSLMPPGCGVLASAMLFLQLRSNVFIVEKRKRFFFKFRVTTIHLLIAEGDKSVVFTLLGFRNHLCLQLKMTNHVCLQFKMTNCFVFFYS